MFLKRLKKLFIYAVLSIAIGAVVGAIEAAFGLGIIYAADARTSFLYWCLPFLPLAGLIIVFCYKKFGKGTERGMGMLFDVWNDKRDKIPVKSVPLIIGSTLLTHLCGGSSGREGVAVQIGASISHSVGRRIKYDDAAKTFMVAGIAAGFAGLFNTPLAAIAFAMEILVIGEIRYEAIIPAALAAISSDFVSSKMGLVPDTFKITAAVELSPLLMLKIILMAILFGLLGLVFSWLLRRGHRSLEKIFKNPYIRIAVVGAAIGVIMILTEGRYSGPGGNLLEECFTTGSVYPQDWFMKLALTVLTLAAGFKGGEVAPLFAIGATFGMFFGPLIGLPGTLCAALGFAAVFGSGTGTLIAPILIGGEVFGWQQMPLFIAVCFIAKMVNQFATIYPDQRKAYILSDQ